VDNFLAGCSGRAGCIINNRGDGRRRTTVLAVGSYCPVGFEGEICGLIFGGDIAQRRRGGGASYGSKNCNFLSCVMWSGVGLVFGAKISVGIFSQPYRLVWATLKTIASSAILDL
jgi:hypothetical protein